MLHLNFITRTRIRRYIITCLTNPSPYSPFDGMGSFLIYIRTSATITATLQRKHIIQEINGLWWQIICNGQWSSATPPWQIWQMVFSASATGTHWFSNVWASVADVYVILYDNSLFCHPEEPCDEGSRVHPLYHSLLYVHETLRFALDDTIKNGWQWRATVNRVKDWNTNFHVYRKRNISTETLSTDSKIPFHSPWQTSKRVKGDSPTRQDAFMNSSKSFHENI